MTVEKADLSYRNPKRTLGLTMLFFLEIIKLQFGNKNATHSLYFKAF